MKTSLALAMTQVENKKTPTYTLKATGAGLEAGFRDYKDAVMLIDDLAPTNDTAMERELLLDPELNSSQDIRRPCRITADHYLIDGEMVTEAGITMKTLFTPGHTEGGCCYYITAEESGGDPILLSGDTLFEESIGRTDLPTGSMHELTESIRGKLYVLPDNTQVYSGHGGTTTIEHEKKYNYFVRP